MISEYERIKRYYGDVSSNYTREGERGREREREGEKEREGERGGGEERERGVGGGGGGEYEMLYASFHNLIKHVSNPSPFSSLHFLRLIPGRGRRSGSVVSKSFCRLHREQKYSKYS